MILAGTILGFYFLTTKGSEKWNNIELAMSDINETILIKENIFQKSVSKYPHNINNFSIPLNPKFPQLKVKKSLKEKPNLFISTIDRDRDHYDELGDRKGGKILVNDQELLERLRKFAFFASLAYCLDDQRGKVIPGIYAESIVVKSSENSQKELIIYIRGSASIQTWFKRKFNLEPYPNIPKARVDKSFANQFYKLSLKVKAMIPEVALKRLNFVGHGLGGVFAVLLAQDLSETWDYVEMAVYTFGQPRIGDKYFALEINNWIAVHRVTFYDDIVTRLPLDNERNGFMHHGTEFWISPYCECGDYKVYKCLGTRSLDGFTDENPSCSNAFKTININSHNGPYFGQYMGICPEYTPSWALDF
ncbi:hypothetical protein G9A89_020245 [Geosiphon pyriformis]|nr:hypothetical protein G9A89_020245 [Geosiphon pyriformis]